MFSCGYCEIFKNTFFTEHLRWPVLTVLQKTSNAKWLYNRKNQSKIDGLNRFAENNEIISSYIEVAKTFQNLFSSIVKTSNIQREEETHLSKNTQINLVLACFEKFSKHPSIISIKKRMEITSNKFSFKYEERKKITEIQNLNFRKASLQNAIPVKILKEN